MDDTRTRIRDAAIARFAAAGVGATTLRSIAEAAGVSAQLVVHHFGSKAALAVACDEHVTATIRAHKTAVMAAGPNADPVQALRDSEAEGPLLAYLARRLADDSPGRPRRARPRGRPGRCTASSAPTGPASRPPSGSCSACCAPTPARLRMLGGDPWRDAGGAAPSAGLRARRRRAVAEPHRRRGHRPVRPAAGRARPAPPRRAVRAVRPRPDEEGPDLLQGQPAEGRPDRRAGLRRRAAPARRADRRARPADGGGLPGLHPGGEGAGTDRAALQPHPRPGRGARRPDLDHPAGPDRRVRHPRRPAPPDPHHDHGRDDRPPTGSLPARGPRPGPGGRPGPLRGRRRPASTRRSALAPLGVRSLVAHPPTLEQLLLRHYGDELAATA
jgi:AcrR family transcriptional regulator